MGSRDVLISTYLNIREKYLSDIQDRSENLLDKCTILQTKLKIRSVNAHKMPTLPNLILPLYTNSCDIFHILHHFNCTLSSSFLHFALYFFSFRVLIEFTMLSKINIKINYGISSNTADLQYCRFPVMINQIVETLDGGKRIKSSLLCRLCDIDKRKIMRKDGKHKLC